jgi:hypothetical protein
LNIDGHVSLPRFVQLAGQPNYTLSVDDYRSWVIKLDNFLCGQKLNLYLCQHQHSRLRPKKMEISFEIIRTRG